MMDFVRDHYLMLSKSTNQRMKMLCYVEELNKNQDQDSTKNYALRKTLKMGKYALKKNQHMMKMLIVEIKRNQRQNTLKYFIAKRLPTLVSHINRATIQMTDCFNINSESEAAIKQRLSRLKLLRKPSYRSTSPCKKSKSTEKATPCKKVELGKRRKSIFQLFGDSKINQIIYEQEDDDI